MDVAMKTSEVTGMVADDEEEVGEDWFARDETFTL